MIDINGREIYPGDLLKSPHFRDGRRQYWLYHVAVMRDKAMWAVPVSHLEPTRRSNHGACLLGPQIAATMEIIHGHGPGDGMYFTDRKREKAGK